MKRPLALIVCMASILSCSDSHVKKDKVPTEDEHLNKSSGLQRSGLHSMHMRMEPYTTQGVVLKIRRIGC